MTWDDACAIAREFPAVEDGSYHGYPALRVAGKFLMRLSDDGLSIEFKALESGEREMLLGAFPGVFHIPPAFGGRGMFARLSKLDDATLRELLERRWRRAAPRGLVKAYDRQSARA